MTVDHADDGRGPMTTAAKRFVVGVDGSDESRSALRWAVDEAAAWDAELDVVHALDLPFVIVPPPINLGYERDVETAEQAATAMLNRELSAVMTPSATPSRIETIVLRKRVSNALLEKARGADLLVVGSRGTGGFRGLLLGSTSNQCVHYAPCPVAVIRSVTDAGSATSPDAPIVVGVDGSDGGQEALIWATAHARRRHVPIVALAAWSWLDQPGPFDPAYGEKDVTAMAEAAVERARGEAGDVGNVDIEVRPVNDHAASALITASSEARLLVVGSRGLGGFRGLLLGSVSNKCVHHARCPVVVVRS